MFDLGQKLSLENFKLCLVKISAKIELYSQISIVTTINLFGWC